MKLHRNLAIGAVNALNEIINNKTPSRVVIPKLFKTNPSWGSRDRKLISKLIFESLRWKRLFEYYSSIDRSSEFYFWEIIGSCFANEGYSLPVWKEFKNIDVKDFLEKKKKKSDIKKPILNSFPDWLYREAEKQLGKNIWEKEIKALNTPAKLIIRVNTLKTTISKLKRKLHIDYNIMSSIDTKYPDAIILDKNYKILNNKLYKEGFFEIQDANSQQVSVWVDPKPGMKVVDACAGAGGKTLHLVSLMNNKGEVYCIDKYPNKLEILRKRTHKNGVTIVKTILEEDHSFFDKNKHQMDCVLIDVPCSSLGVLKRKPELKWKINKKTSEGLESIQKDLLQKNSSLVKNGGVLIYATCTLFKNENEDQIDSFLTTEKGKRFNLIKQETFYSHKTGYDGFFIAKLVANNVNN